MDKREQHVRAEPSSPASTWMPAFLRRRAVCGAAAIAIVTLFAYAPALRGGFIWDDNLLITKNRLVRAGDGLYRMWFTTEPIDYWPLTNSSFWLEWRLWGMNPIGYHVTNVVLHIAAALLVWAILRKLSIPGAYLAAALFALHPLNVESVAWISQRKNTLAMLFFLVSILCYLCAEKRREVRGQGRKRSKKEENRRTKEGSSQTQSGSQRWYWLSLLALVLAMLSKGSVAVLPLVLLLIVWWQRRRITLVDFARLGPFFIVAALLTVVDMQFQTHGSAEVVRSAGLVERFAGAGGAIWFYLSKALLPIELISVYPQWHIEAGDVRWWLPLLAASVVTAVLIGQRNSPAARWSRQVWFAWVFWCIALLPVLGIVDVGFMRFSLVADHYAHIALVGLVASIAAGWTAWYASAQRTARPAAILTVVIVITTFTLLAFQQSRLYADAITFYQAASEKNPDSWMIHNNLGMELVAFGRLPEGIEHYQHALQLQHNSPEVERNLGVALAKSARLPDAIEHYQRALQIKPAYAEAHYNLANALAQTGRNSEAVEQYQQALQMKPDYVDARTNLGTVLSAAGRHQEAVEQFAANLRFDPESPTFHNILGQELAAIGRVQDAVEQYQLAIKLQPEFSQAYANLATAFAQLHRHEQAVAAGQKALRLARSAGQATQAQQIEAWLTNYDAKQKKVPTPAPTPEQGR